MPAVVTKKFLNTPEQIVDDSINGLVAGNDRLQISKLCKRVVLRSDINDKTVKNKVSLIAGGGSGHEPFAAGFVGKGFLTAAVCGDIFTSPPSAYVTAALKDVSSEEGTVVFVINYTGDRLNFGLAVERFNQIETVVIIGDDIALEGHGSGSVGRRGLAGAVLVMKIAGAMAEDQIKSEKIAAVAQQINDCIGTLGVSLSACSIPGKAPMFALEPDEMELGLGIHGEPGCERTKLVDAKAVIDILFKRLEKSEKSCLVKGSKLVVLLNNLGGTSHIEMNVVARESLAWLEQHGYDVARFYSGTVMTSLDGHGISITVLKLVSKFVTNSINFYTLLFLEASERFEKCLRNACSSIVHVEEELNKLDSKAGDGDCGHTLAKGAKSDIICTYPAVVFQKLSTIFEMEVGGTAGALYALMFNAAASAFSDGGLTECLHKALKNGLDAVMRYGEARPGFRSMGDWERLVKVSELAAKATAQMTARCGRASYTSEATQVEPDPGATAVAVWLRSIFEAAF
uniref:Triokinase/FMN cyclase n=1 Tax=Syphacia muris TaxID=451379 RepID=A0A0N5AE71_9BILA